MKPIPLTPENAESIAKLAALIGWTSDELANHLLAETLEMFADQDSGSLEGFLGAIYYADRRSAQRACARVTQMTRASFGGRLPESFKSEIDEHLDGTFNFPEPRNDRRLAYYFGALQMKIRLLLALVWLAISFALPSFAQDQNTVDPEVRQQIEALSMKFVEAFNKYDAASLAALFTEDAVEVRNWPSDDHGGTASGREAIKKRFAADFAFNPGKMVTEIVQEYALGNDICAIANTSVGKLKNQSATFYVRDADTWKIRMAYVNLPSHRELKPLTPVQE